VTERPKTTERKRQILAAALSCYSDHGYGNASVEKIRDLAGVSVGSIYHHFGNKEGIYAALFMEGMRDYHQVLQASLDKSSTAKQAIETLIYCFSDWVISNPDWARFVFYERQTIMNTAYKAQVMDDNRAHFNVIKATLGKYVEEGAIRQMPPDLFNALIMGATQYHAKQWLTGRAKTPLADCVDTLAEAAWLSVKA
jgi:AcrR family transcriptional regulator